MRNIQILDDDSIHATVVNQQPTPPSDSQAAVGSTEHCEAEDQHLKKMEIDGDGSAGDMLSPMSIEEKQEEPGQPALTHGYTSNSPSTSYDFSNVRVCLKCDMCLMDANANVLDHRS